MTVRGLLRWMLGLFSWFLVSGCVGVDPAGNDNAGNDNVGDDPGIVDLTAVQRGLVEQTVARTFDDALYTTVMSHDAEQGFALSLVGVSQGWRGTAFLVQECEEAITFDPFCDLDEEPPGEGGGDDEFWQTHTRCSQLECEAAGVTLTHIFFTQKPHTDRADRHAFTYDTDDPAGSAVYDPNPAITWRTQFGEDDVVTVSADLRQDLVVTTEEGSVIDLDFQGRVELTRAGEVSLAATLEMTFGTLIESDVPVQVSFEIDADENGAGTVTVGAQTLATLSLSPEDIVIFDWLGPNEP